MLFDSTQILLIEDSDDDAGLLRQLLIDGKGKWHFSVSHVRRLSEGLKELHERSFDIVLTDLELPDSQGIETAFRVRKQSEVVPIIVLTGFDDEESALKALQMDIQDYLVKSSISRNVLVRSIRYAIGRKLAERRLAVQYAVVRLLAEAVSMDDATPALLNVICEHVGWDLGEIWLVDTSTASVRLHGVWHNPAQDFSEFTAVSRITIFHCGQGLPGRVWEHEKPSWIPDVMSDASFPRLAAATAAGLHGAFAFPISSRGEIIGVMTFFSRKVQPQDENLMNMFAALGSQIGDFLARKQAERDLKQYSEELNRSNKDLEMFASIASHDLQDPLHAIGGFAALLERRYKGRLGKKADDIIGYILDSTFRMEQLIKDLLNYSRVTSRRKPFTRAACDKVLEIALMNLKTAIKESGAVITSDPLPTITVDESQLIQLFQNLVGNAIKYRRKNETPRIHIQAKSISDNETKIEEMTSEKIGLQSKPCNPKSTAKKKWLFSIQDHGIGIAPEHSKRIFEAFQRLHKHEEYPGTGIGLAICKKIVELHGGSIWVESGVGRGSVFYFTLCDQTIEEKTADIKMVA